MSPSVEGAAVYRSASWVHQLKHDELHGRVDWDDVRRQVATNRLSLPTADNAVG